MMSLMYIYSHRYNLFHPFHLLDLYVLGTHDIRALLNEVKQAGRYSFFNVSTEYGDVVSIAQYHQMCRYGINLEEKDRDKEKENIKTLENIMNWLKEEI